MGNTHLAPYLSIMLSIIEEEICPFIGLNTLKRLKGTKTTLVFRLASPNSFKLEIVC